MKRKLIALLCAVAVLTGIFAVVATAAEETNNERYQVGYSKMDINPWLDPNDHSKGIILAGDDSLGIPLSGYGGDSESRIATSRIDDNGDGKIDDGDGLFTTCTIVADPDGKLLIFFTLDCISPYGTLVSTIRSDVVSALTEQGANISSDRIMITGSHSHTSVRFDTIKDSSDAYRSAYYEYIISQMTQAAVAAYGDMAEATMTKRELDVSKDYGYQLNWVRHVNVPFDVKQTISGGNTTTLGSGTLVAGSNFGYFAGTKTLYETWYSSTTVKAVMDTSSRTHVAAADDTLQMLTFEFTDSSKDTVVMIDWRAHPDNISGTYISSDYVGSLRYRLEQNKSLFGGEENYRVGFWQGASGNINAFSAIEDEAYFDAEVSGLVNDGAAESKSSVPYNKYGYMLAEAALLNLEGSKGTTTDCSVGSIRNLQISKYTVDRHVFTDAEKAAAAAIGTTYAQAEAKPYPYEDSASGGVINSKYHWNKVNEQINQIAAGTFKATFTIEINALMIGEDMAFVVAPNELFDRYDADMSIDDADNDWNELINNNTYGTPFVLAYTNNHMGYIPNVMAYHYNEGDEYTGYNMVGTGSYEANTANYAEGTGEALVDQYAFMLQLLSGDALKKVCAHCGGEAVEWTPVTKNTYQEVWEPGGHYYLTEDVGTDYSAQKVCGTSGTTKYTEDGTFCLDLNGFNIDTIGRAFNSRNNNTLNLMDSVGTGKVISYSGNNNVGGGVFSVASGAALNIYGGTYQFIRTEEGVNEATPTAKGGVIATAGTTTMYGGTLIGGQLGLAGNDAEGVPYISTGNGCGGTVSVNAGTFNIFGGKIQSGKAAEGSVADCVYIDNTSSKVVLSGDACVDEIYVSSYSNACVTVKGAYIGTVAITFNDKTLTNNTYIGRSDAADISDADITVADSGNLKIGVYGNYLRMTEQTDSTKAVVTGSVGTLYTTTISAALNYAADNDLVTFLADDTVSSVRTVSKNVCIDLNGHSTIGFSVSSGYTLCVKDSKTDDYTVEDDDYGRIGTVSGNVTGMDGYVKITEDDGVSFHKVDLEIKTLTLRPGDVGMYYKSDFKGDEVVARNVVTYGVALSAKAVPDETNMQTQCEYSWFEDFVGGTQGNNNQATSTILKNIMKPENGYMANKSNAATAVYGRAYILTEDGYSFGSCVSYSLRDALEAVDAQLWSGMESEDKTAVVDMCVQYLPVVNTWNIPNIRSEVNTKIEQGR